MIIEVGRGWVVGMLAVLLAAALMSLGWRVSPRDMAGRPVLLLPEVRSIEGYRRQAVAWTLTWQALAVRLENSLNSGDADLLAQSQEARGDLDQALELAEAVEATEAPPALVGLQEDVRRAAQAFAATGLAVNRWISAPSDANQAAARAAYEQARTALAVLEANGWIKPDLATSE